MLYRKDMYKISRILLKYFTFGTNDEESQLLDQWRRESDRNENLFQEMDSPDFWERAIDPIHKKMQEEQWHLLQMKIRIIKDQGELVRDDIEKTYKRIRRRLYIRRLSSVAAVLVLLCGIGVSVWKYAGTWDKSKGMEQIESIRPGGKKAVLYLASGETIPLAKVTGEIQKEGTVIRVDEKDGVSYDPVTEEKEKIVHRIVVPRGGEYKMELGDGTKIWLNSDSEISYPVQFAEDKRAVSLRGEAYFEVSKDESRPFIVNVEQMTVKVYGTKFNVNNQMKGIVETVLVEGRVGIIADDKEIILMPKQKAVYDQEKGDVYVQNVDITSYVAWKDGNFVFDNASLGAIMDKLSLWYDVDVFYGNDEVRNVHLSGDMVRYKEIQNLLYFFEQISDVKFEIKGRTIVVNYK